MIGRWGRGICAAAAAVALCAWVGTARAQQQKKLPNLGSAANIGPKPPVGSGGCSTTSPSCADVAPLIIASALGHSPLRANLRYLTDTIGGRRTGSKAEERAVRWAVERFRLAGVDNVHTEEFTMPVRWTPGRARLTVLAPEGFPVRVVSAGWSPATPKGGIAAAVLDVGAGTKKDFAEVGTKARGALLLVETKPLKTPADLANEYRQQARVLRLATKAGARGVLWMADWPYLITYRLMDSMGGRVGRLPEAIVAREDALRLASFLKTRTPVRARLILANKLGGPFQAANVVAEIRGREKPKEFVILGAQLDSWDLGTGALDDGCSAAMVIDAARAIRAAHVRPVRSILFVLFSGEDEGMMGSWAFARAHRAELGETDAAILYGGGDGPVSGYLLNGRPGLEAALRKAMAPASQFHADHDSDAARLRSAGLDFLLEGVPTLVPIQKPGSDLIDSDADSDTYDKVDIAALKREEAVAALTAYGIADLPQRLGKRQTRAEIGKLLERTGIEKEMKKEGIWKLWERGKRGRRR